jgi:hypothetical protein
MKTKHRKLPPTLLVCVLLSFAATSWGFYDPGLQRWINRDPISEAGGFNLYSFAANHPGGNYDALGLDLGEVIRLRKLLESAANDCKALKEARDENRTVFREMSDEEQNKWLDKIKSACKTKKPCDDPSASPSPPPSASTPAGPPSGPQPGPALPPAAPEEPPLYPPPPWYRPSPIRIIIIKIPADPPPTPPACDPPDAPFCPVR